MGDCLSGGDNELLVRLSYDHTLHRHTSERKRNVLLLLFQIFTVVGKVNAKCIF